MSISQDPAEEYRGIEDHCTRLVDAVPDDATWSLPAPPAGWTARDVVRHLIDWFPGFLQGGAGITLPSGPSVDEDPTGAWRAMSDGVQAVLDNPATAHLTFSNEHTGELPVPQAISQFFTQDVFMHSWDLARATGQDETLDPERCRTMVAKMEPWDEALRSSGQYGPRVDVPDDADSQTKLLAFIGPDPTTGNVER